MLSTHSLLDCVKIKNKGKLPWRFTFFFKKIMSHVPLIYHVIKVITIFLICIVH